MKIVDHGTWPLTPADESLHTPGAEPLWNESYYYDFAAPDGSYGGYVRLGLYPNWNRAWYWACIVGPDREPLILVDDFAPLPSEGTDLKTEAYRATQTLSPDFAKAHIVLDGVTASGTRLAFDLEWTTEGGVYPYKDLPRYEVPCKVTGTVTAGEEVIAVDASGERDHSWGERDWWGVSWLWTSGRLDDGTYFHGMQANIGIPLAWPCFQVSPSGTLDHLDGFSAETVFGADDLPASSRLRVPGAPLTAVPLAFASVDVTSPTGQEAVFPRALCRFTADDGRVGYGWAEWHQPPAWRDHGWSFLGEER
ncbi:hypothetical protein EDD29_6270 [Actinocorallia herbida]|uniref:DUF7064 domain-containing protein n=1 Tax=Actinocorallia herbida TaxID=58109 RepID=A0A3N1D559_9ACTN|nr:hypothetical protein [Actinocorallia herbida]ROO88596.1 hypothetical protein EDD29_6270 [Actinocorallia herbida]